MQNKLNTSDLAVFYFFFCSSSFSKKKLFYKPFNMFENFNNSAKIRNFKKWIIVKTMSATFTDRGEVKGWRSYTHKAKFLTSFNISSIATIPKGQLICMAFETLLSPMRIT